MIQPLNLSWIFFLFLFFKHLQKNAPIWTKKKTLVDCKRMEDKPTPKMEASLGLCQPQRNNCDMEIKSEFSKGREVSKEGQRETMTSPTIQVVSLDAGREK